MDGAMMTALSLAEKWHCSPQTVLDTPADLVLAALEYQQFMNEYQETTTELNKET